MTRSELESITRQWISLWCVPVDWALFDQLHAENFKDCASAGRETTRAAFAAGLREFTEAFPDLHMQVEDLVVDEARGRVAVRWSAVGTNARAFLGVGPTEKRTPITGMEIIEITGGKIVRRWGEWDIPAHG